MPVSGGASSHAFLSQITSRTGSWLLVAGRDSQFLDLFCHVAAARARLFLSGIGLAIRSGMSSWVLPRSETRQRLLAYYFTNPTARLHLRDLAERLSTDPSNLSKELRRLEREGLFRSEISGRQKYFQLNRDYPLFDEVRRIVGKTIGAQAAMRKLLRKIEGIDEAYLYGSFAKNQQDAASDIDVLVIGTPREETLVQVVRKLERQLGREINYTVLTHKEFESRRARKDAFLENVWHNKHIPLIVRDEKAQTAYR